LADIILPVFADEDNRRRKGKINVCDCVGFFTDIYSKIAQHIRHCYGPIIQKIESDNPTHLS